MLVVLLLVTRQTDHNCDGADGQLSLIVVREKEEEEKQCPPRSALAISASDQWVEAARIIARMLKRVIMQRIAQRMLLWVSGKRVHFF